MKKNKRMKKVVNIFTLWYYAVDNKKPLPVKDSSRGLFI